MKAKKLTLKNKNEKLESELKALREERDKFAEWYNKLPKDQIVTLMGSAIIYMTPLEELFAKFKAYTLNTEKNGK